MTAERMPLAAGATRIAAIQTVSGTDVEANLATAGRLVAEAAATAKAMVRWPT